ncbi:MAG: SDR family NAD(P)-dependent oxidoreductase, partial [Steroidobacteraceae bacterium]
MSDTGTSLANLAGQAALVTGAARRVGAAIVRGLHADGADVCIHCHRSVAEAEQLRDALNRERARSACIAVADLLDLKALPGIVATATDAFGRLDVLINNASTFYPSPLESADPSQWEDLIGTNLRAPFFLAQAATAHLRKSKGLIV